MLGRDIHAQYLVNSYLLWLVVVLVHYEASLQGINLSSYFLSSVAFHWTNSLCAKSFY